MAAAVTPDDVADAPELLVLVSLDATLMALRAAVFAAFPDLPLEPAKQREAPLLASARLLMLRAWMLDDAIRRYREELEYARPPDPFNIEELPF